MRTLIAFLFFISTTPAMWGQTPKQEFKQNLRLSGSNLMPYPQPAQKKLTPPPHGKKPFYLSHYGRHGSRYMNNSKDYDYALNMLQQADLLGKLSPLGKDVLERVQMLQQEATGRLGELTTLGVSQLRDIARRLTERFPEIFMGDTHIDAKSTTAVRCVLSMGNSVQQLLMLNPQLDINQDASQTDMPYMSYGDRQLAATLMTPPVKEAYETYCQRHLCWQRMVGSLFSDTAYVSQRVNGERLNYYLFRLAAALQNTELRKHITLYDLFTDDEILANWQMENAYWFLGYSHTPINGGLQPYTQRHLLRRLLHDADSCLLLPRASAQLRFGHETMLLPLVCLMGINGYDQPISDLSQLERKGWINYRIFPMAANLQLVFYRKNHHDLDILVQVLLNENEATLPVKTDCAPYYHWRDVRAYLMEKLEQYEKLKTTP